MFVFPAFDSNYKTRKRTFRCCHNCRSKRVKCDISRADYEYVGCASCVKHNWTCDLKTKTGEAPSRSDEGDRAISTTPKSVESSDHRVNNSVENIPDFTPSAHVSSKPPHKRQLSGSDNTQKKAKRRDSVPESRTLLSKDITPQFLKDKFNFNISGKESDSNYQYVFHDHPKAIINAKFADRSIYHESGVYVDLQHTSDYAAENNKSYKVRNFDGSEKQTYIRNKKVYDFLLSIDAFTLSSVNFRFEDHEISQLVELYFLKLNYIFPIVHSKRFWDDFHANKAQSVIIYAIVLAISRDKMAEPILRNVFSRCKNNGVEESGLMSDDEYHEQFVTFVTELEFKIRQVLLILPELGDIDKLTKLVVLLLLSMHFKFDRLGNEQSSHDLTAAINLAGSLGIQMRPTNKYISKEKEEYSNNLWWCCYVFDRINAVVNCRFLFIRHDDFNLELPYNNLDLLRLVQLARSIEKMLFSIFQPFNNAYRQGDSKAMRDKMFDIDLFQDVEFAVCDDNFKQAREGLLPEEKLLQTCDDIGSLKLHFPEYISSMIHLLTRLVNNTIILTAQKRKYDDQGIPNKIPETTALHASSNILWYLSRMKPELIIHIPLIPWCITIAMACSLKRKAKSSLQINGSVPDIDESQYRYQVSDYMNELEKYSSKWWVVEEICHLCKDFLNKLDRSAKSINTDAWALNTASANNGRQYMPQLSEQQTPLAPSTEEMSPSSLKAYKPIPSIKSMLSLMPEELPNNTKPTMPTDNNSSGMNRSGISQLGTSAMTSPLQYNDGFIPAANNPGQENGYDAYFDSMHIDVFDNDFFKDLPQMMNFLS